MDIKLAKIRPKRIQKGSKLVIRHKDYKRLTAYVTAVEGEDILVERYCHQESRWMQNGPHKISAEDVIKVLRY